MWYTLSISRRIYIWSNIYLEDDKLYKIIDEGTKGEQYGDFINGKVKNLKKSYS